MNQTDPAQYAVQSAFSDPGVHAHLFDDLPSEVPQLAAVIRNLLIHYRAAWHHLHRRAAGGDQPSLDRRAPDHGPAP